MDKLLFLSNGNKPTKEEYEFVGEEKLTNFSIPVVLAAKEVGLSTTVGVNRKNPEKLTCEYPVSFYNAEIYRNPFNFKEVRKAYENAKAEIEKGNYLAIHCNTPIGGVIGRVLGHNFGIQKVIYTVHGFHFFRGAPVINRVLYKWIEQLLAHWTDVIITINQEDYEAAKHFKLRKGGKIFKVHGVGINLNDYRDIHVDRAVKRRELGLSDTDFICVSAGDLVPRKNYGVAIESIAKTNRSDVHYLICGNGPEYERLKKVAKNNGIEKQIHFLGFRTDIMKISDVFLFTSLQEGLPRSLMEAMAVGLPVVCSRIRGNIDLICDGVGGLLCDPKNAEEFSKALLCLIQDPEKRRKMAQQNLYKIKEYDVSIVMEELKAIYQTIF